MEEKKTDELEELEMFRKEKAVRDNISKEMEEFGVLFPDKTVDDIPDEVWEMTDNGKGLCAYFALYLKKGEIKAEAAEKSNDENSKSAVPEVKSECDDKGYFTPEAVRKMSESDVKRNYKAIMKSMEKWDR